MGLITTLRVQKTTRDELDGVHKELRSKDSRFSSKDVVITELIECYRYVKNINKSDEDVNYDIE